MPLDSHQHFWRYDEAQYPWILQGSPLHRDWLPADLAALQEPLGIDGSIAVQARQTLEESRWLLQLADENPHIRGVVGWVDLRSDRVEEQIAEFSAHPNFCGVRHVVQDEPDENFILGADFQRGISKLQQFGLTYDILIFPRQLSAAIELAHRFPTQPFVLDHIGKPNIKDRVMEPWRELIQELAQAANVHCKVSGMVTEADRENWAESEFIPFLDAVFEAFGPSRLMWGSDWPVCLAAAQYSETLRIVEGYASHLSIVEQCGLFGDNAATFYGI